VGPDPASPNRGNFICAPHKASCFNSDLLGSSGQGSGAGLSEQNWQANINKALQVLASILDLASIRDVNL